MLDAAGVEEAVDADAVAEIICSRDVRYSNSDGGGGGTFCERVAEIYMLDW